MPRFKPKGMLERNAAEDLWKHTLQKIPTLYGRLTYLSSLRDPNSGVYRHHGFSASFGREESGKALRSSHEQIFYEWLNLPLAAKHRDLMEYLTELEEPKGVVVNHWLRSRIYRNQAPSSARQVERELFFRDLEALLETLKSGLGGGAADQESSRPA